MCCLLMHKAIREFENYITNFYIGLQVTKEDSESEDEG